jgi:transcription initiation factor TFIIIB Brf1 subunit/transcription initiation factor TFIIB
MAGRVAEIDLAGRSFAEVMLDLEAQYLAGCLEAAGLNQREAAERAGLTYDTFRRRFAAIRPRLTITVTLEPEA